MIYALIHKISNPTNRLSAFMTLSKAGEVQISIAGTWLIDTEKDIEEIMKLMISVIQESDEVIVLKITSWTMFINDKSSIEWLKSKQR
jgi:hypothetical protein